ncbi:hypothetical protein [Candidatus Culexarchaeum yellowstonense]|uniref:hypothetical protein n=1 Tax=Candidatus Culexarchaeum yellowstonense TaxID=2928963 RepID=UPI0026F28C5E|nr:hypothetical protein [Candidatus Culexarchaeum yellowstonense]
MYLGSLGYVAQNELTVLKNIRRDVIVLNAYYDEIKVAWDDLKCENIINLYEPALLKALYKSIGHRFTAILLNLLNYRLDLIKRIIREYNIELIYANWGSNMIPLIKMLQNNLINIPIMYNFMTYPQNVYSWKVFLENWYCRKPIERLDGRIHASQNMYRYMSKRFDLKKHGLDMIVTPFFSEKYHYRKRLPLLSEKDGEPHLVYIGPLTSSRNWDDIRQEIYEIANEGIHIHLAETNVPLRKSPYIHFFPYFPLPQLINGSLATYMTQFDACIVLFNFKVCSCLDRFYTSFPSRFLFALNAGIPIVMPKGYLLTCEQFVNEHQIGFAYKNLTELKDKLNNFELMQEYRKNAIRKTVDFTYEKEFHKLEKLIKVLT